MPSTRARKTAAVPPASSVSDVPPPEDSAPRKTARKTPARKTATRKKAVEAAVVMEAPIAAEAAPAPKTAAPAKASRKRATPRRKVVDEPTVVVPVPVPEPAPNLDPGPGPGPVGAASAAIEPVATEEAPVVPAKAPRKRAAPRQRAKAPAEVPAPLPDEPVVAPPVAPGPPPQRHSEVTLVQDGFGQRIEWSPADDCPAPLLDCVAALRGPDGGLDPSQDEAWLRLQAVAQSHGHELRIAAAVWAAVARGRDVRWRVHLLEQAYPEGAGSAALRALWADGAPRLAPYHLEGALFAACAGRALLADDAGLDPAPQAFLAAQLLARHCGVQRVLVLRPEAVAPLWQRLRLQAGLDGSVQIRFASTVPADGWQPEFVIVDDLHPWPEGPPCAHVRALQAAYALVLMQEPADRPQVLADWLAWLDVDGLGAARRLRQRHLTEAGWQALDRLRDTLGSVMLRRTRSRWLQPVPGRRDKLHWTGVDDTERVRFLEGLRRLEPVVDRWRRVGYVSDLDQLAVREVLQGWREAGALDTAAKVEAVRSLWSQGREEGAVLHLVAADPAAAKCWAAALQATGLPVRHEAHEAAVWVGDAVAAPDAPATPARAWRIALSLPWPADQTVADGGPSTTYLVGEGGLDEQRLLLRCCDAGADAVLSDATLFCQGAALARRIDVLAALLDRGQEAVFRNAC